MSNTRDLLGHYTLHQPLSEEAILEAAEDILRRRLERLGAITDPTTAASFFRARLAGLGHEEFHAMWLDARYNILHVELLARGSLTGAQVHPRELVRSALRYNAAACILAHNHPSGVSEPSQADLSITRRLREALDLVEVRILDHLVVSAAGSVSFAARGWL